MTLGNGITNLWRSLQRTTSESEDGMTQRSYGVHCYNCDESVNVDFDHGDYMRANQETEDKAAKLGWGIGLMASGQAYFSCPDCAGGLFNFHQLVPRTALVADERRDV